MQSSLEEDYASQVKKFPEIGAYDYRRGLIDAYLWAYESLVMAHRRNPLFSGGAPAEIPIEDLNEIHVCLSMFASFLNTDYPRMSCLGTHWRRQELPAILVNDFESAQREGIFVDTRFIRNYVLMLISSAADDLTTVNATLTNYVHGASERSHMTYVSEARPTLEKIIRSQIKRTDNAEGSIVLGERVLGFALATPSEILLGNGKVIDLSAFNDYFYNGKGIEIYRRISESSEYTVKSKETNALKLALEHVHASASVPDIGIHDLACGFGGPGSLAYISAKLRGFSPVLYQYDSSEKMLVDAGIFVRTKGVLGFQIMHDVCSHPVPKSPHRQNIYLCTGNVTLDWTIAQRERFYANVASSMQEPDYFIIGVRISDEPNEVLREYSSLGRTLNELVLEEALGISVARADELFEYGAALSADFTPEIEQDDRACVIQYFRPKQGEVCLTSHGATYKLNQDSAIITSRVYVKSRAEMESELNRFFGIEKIFQEGSYMIAVCRKPSSIQKT